MVKCFCSRTSLILLPNFKADQLPQNLAFLDKALITFGERIPQYFINLAYQRDALLEAVRLWRKLETRTAAIASILQLSETDPSLASLDESALDRPLVQFIIQISPFYAGYPHQREALLRLTQLWRRLDSRAEAIASLGDNTSAETNIKIIDSALIAFIQRIPQYFQGKGEQRNAIAEGFRLWRGFDSRSTALKELGIDPQVLSSSNPNPGSLANAAAQLDRELLNFLKRLPTQYRETEPQREALIRLVQLWRGLDARDKCSSTTCAAWKAPAATLPMRRLAPNLCHCRLALAAGHPTTCKCTPQLLPMAALLGQKQPTAAPAFPLIWKR
jgi:hypothetical protein